MAKDRRSWLDISRRRLRATKIIERLTAHVNGEVDMKPSQVAAGLGLLRKIMPDLTAVELNGNVEHRNIVSSEPLTEQQWAEQYSTQH